MPDIADRLRKMLDHWLKAVDAQRPSKNPAFQGSRETR